MPKRKAVRSKKGASIKKGSTSNSDIVTNTSEDTLSSPAQEREETLNESIEKQEDIAAEGNLRQEVCLKTSCDGTEVTTSVVLPNQIESNDTIHDVTERVNPQNTEAEEKCEPAEHTGSQESEKNAAECELDFCEVKGAEDDDDEVQYIDEEAEEEQQLTGVMESSTGDKGSHLNDMPNTELDLSTNISDESKTEKSILVKFSDSAAKAATLEAESSKFEEISEGSIDQTEQDDLINEESADVEITGVSFNSKENISQFPQSDFQLVKSHVPYSAAESLEEVFFATENDDLKIPAEDKDNDDISDSSFSDNGRTNLSLEEISDDDLEPSKKRRKSVGLMHQKRENISDTKRSLRDIQSKTEPKLLKGNEISEDSNKRLASAEEDEARITKRLKLSEEKDAVPVNDLSLAKNDVEVNVEQVKERNSVDLKLKTENLDKTDEISSSAVFGGKSKKDDKSPTEVSKYGGKITAQTSKHDHYDGKDKIPSGRDYIEPRRRYELIHSSTQTEAKVLKGKIVQCNINPIDQYFESVKLFGAMEGKFECSKLLKKFKHLLPSSIPVKIFTDITSVKPATKVHNYTFSMGPVTMSDMDSHEFRDVAVKGAERFHLAFDTYCQGIFQCTISKYENIASLIKSLKGLELGNRYMCMSFTYNLGTDKENDVWKATLLYMYEQDIHTESISLISDEKIRSKLLLHGLPSGVSKDFINLLFPEALSVNTISGVNEERVVALGFSNTKMVEEILTCYDLVIVNGCQVKITQVELNDTSCEAESADVIIIDEDSSVCKLLPKDKEVMYSDRSADAHIVSEKGTESRHTLTDNFTGVNNDILKDRISQDGDQTNELVEENVILENSHAQLVKEIVHLHQAETNVALMSSDLNSSADRKLEDTQDVDQPKVTSDEGNEAQRDISDKCEISTLSSGLGEVEKETSLIDEAPKPAADDKPTEVFSDSTDVETDTKDIHLEDVSDDDMMNQSKTTVDNFVMIKEEPHIVVNIDLTNDDSESSVNNTSSLKNSKAHDTILPGEAAMNSAFTKGEDEKLVMTDGRLHVSMEVIDVSEDESSEKIIYSKYTRASSKKAKRILKERSGEHSIAQHWENDPWKRHEHKRYDAYSSQRETYSKHPPKDYPARKSPHYQRSHSGDISQNKKMLSLRESSPRHRVPNRESTAVRREKFHHDVRSRSPSPRKESNWYKETEVYRHSRSHYPLEYYSTSSGRKYSSSGQHSGTYDKWQTYTVDSRKPDYYSRQGTESYARQKEWPPRSSTYHSYGSWEGHQHAPSRSGEHILSENRDPGYGEKKYFQRRSRSQSYSDMSSSPDHHSPPRRKWSLEKKSPKRIFKHTSRSPISVSSRSRSLSPVSKSPSLGRTQYKIPEKEALVSSVKQFLHLAKDLRQSKRQMRSITPEPCSPVRSRSPGPYRVHSPMHSPPSPHRFEVSRSHQIMTYGSPRAHSRSQSPVWTRHSRSPNYYKSIPRHHRSPSPSVDNRSKSYKRHDYSKSRCDSYHREKESSRHEYSQRSRTKSSPSIKDLSKSGQWTDQRQTNLYGNSGEQPLQHSYGGYQNKSETITNPQGSSFNPSYPPPSFPSAGYTPQETPNMYQGGSMYQYNNPGQYSYSNMTPNVTNPYMPPTPVPMHQAYQQAFSVLQTAISSQPPPQAHYEPSSSNNTSTSSKNKKSWSKGGSANIFQRVLGSDGSKKQSGAIQKIGDRERQERPKQTKEVRVLTNVPVNK